MGKKHHAFLYHLLSSLGCDALSKVHLLVGWVERYGSFLPVVERYGCFLLVVERYGCFLPRAESEIWQYPLRKSPLGR